MELDNSYLKLSKEIFANILEGFMITDNHHRILDVNASFTRITGFSREEVIGENPRILKSGQHGPEFYKNILRSIGEDGKWVGEIWNCKKNGEFYLQWQSIVSIKDEQSGKKYFVSVFTDITEQKKYEHQLVKDLQLAKTLQESLAPQAILEDKISISAFYWPSRDIGGDMYAWFPIDQNRYGVILVDVMGSGVSASLISMSLRALLRGIITRLVEPIAVMTELNIQMRRMFSSSSPILYYCTAIYLLVDTSQGRIEYVNAGHPAGIFLNGNEEVHLLEQGMVPVGLMSDPEIEKEVQFYEQAGRMILYTDGWVDSAGSTFKVHHERIAQVLRENNHLSHETFVEFLQKNVVNRPTIDDISVVALTLKL
ncbi:MAG TPA: SpoIIE family protein phosphatase [Bacillota bacterium]|nr:SpoIIE family protein phosphatase [Bacillota bacterium]